ncbi:glutamyl-tRNA reductase [Leptotrichia sp. oral taxon 417]|jgi:glutamyl-tRNA reductase|uniref:glutamyl-tRNA reductase n=1 Tax=Leptotrichia sp. oral taxon 417 TaxID=712365 RepID=UPI0015B7C633|nr:glutamyl-tRNA reductase [Leptotrichia sp. oral taxon 417]NWO26246.1 glutamyl-tRNA reductase [Leptotrichia sp. oral taxon 417]VTX62425.1 Glutamyl-tRNA reductase [uncultured Leptotrichia sp.]
MNENLVKNFYILSFSYKNLSLEEREKFVKEGYRHILGEYLEKRVIKGYVAVETCLRIELYLDVSREFEIERLKRDFRVEKMKDYEGTEAVHYLLRVICGLDSIIKGEDQILVQLKKAYFEALDKETTSSFLNIIFNQAIETGKRFRAESRINEKNISLDSIAVKFIKTKFESLEDKKVFVIGVGDLSQSILALLHKMNNCHLTMTNRSLKKSIELQKVFPDVQTAEFSEKYNIIKNMDIVISATSAPHLIIEKAKIEDILNDGKKRFFLDLAVPRDIEISIGEFENVSLYHLEDIWDEYNKNVEKRDEIVEKYFYIIEEQLKKIAEKLEKRRKYTNQKNIEMGENG